MTEERLSDLATLAIHYDIEIPVETVCQSFVRKNPPQSHCLTSRVKTVSF
eukprot:m.89763 g.89763  ORF g.89763 m.89763 type:complete len:50 (+) comp36624_c0_seq4:2692-2841(+)